MFNLMTEVNRLIYESLAQNLSPYDGNELSVWSDIQSSLCVPQ